MLKSKDGQEQVRCYFMGDVELVYDQKTKFSIVAKGDIPAESFILLEQAMLPGVPTFLFPRCAAEVPNCILGAPLGWLPRWLPLFDNCKQPGEFFMRYLRVHLNAAARLYIMGAMLNHSCVPNCERITRDDGLSVVIANRPIAAGEEISVSYMSSVLGTPLMFRQFLLFHRYGFWCDCKACRGAIGIDDEAEMTRAWKKASETRSHGSMDVKIDKLLFDLGKTKYPKLYSDECKAAKLNYERMHAVLNCTPILLLVLLAHVLRQLFWGVWWARTSLGLPG